MFTRYQNRPPHYLTFLALFLIVFGILISAAAAKGETAVDLRQSFSYVSPVVDAEMVSASTTIALRSRQKNGEALFGGISLSVSGSKSGQHHGEKVLAGDGETVIFRPAIPFEAGERVTVTLDSGQETSSYSFDISATVPTEALDLDWTEFADIQAGQESDKVDLDANGVEPFRTAPKDLPRFEVVKSAAPTGGGSLFMSPFDFLAVGRTAAFLLILDDNAEPVYYHRFRGLPNAMDFKRQINGELTYYHRGKGEFIAINDRYEEVGSYAAGNGYIADLHDLQILANGHRLHLIYDDQIIDMSEIIPGGHPSALVTGCIVQEIDTADNVVFEWRSWDHLSILDTTVDVTAEIVNYMNCNSIEWDNDHNLLLSSRNLDEITKINRQTGEVIWRMGGKKNEFAFTNDDGFSRQHDARRLYNGHMTLFDNGVTNEPPRSRGLEIEVDEVGKKVTVLREFHNSPDAFAWAMGSMQRLPGGNSVIGWGASNMPTYTEFDSSGNTVLELHALQPGGSYRSFRFPWQGDPQWPPALIAYANGLDVELFFSWNGSTDTTGYMIYAAPEVGDPWLVDTVAKDGFENYYNFQLPSEGVWNFYVVALDQDSQPTEESNRVTLLIGGKPVYLPMISLAEEVQNN